MDKIKDIERSIIKKYRKEIWSKFVKAIKEYQLINDSDQIAVCISGGKDSMLLAKCMQELQKYSDIKFELEFITMDPGYNHDNLENIKNNAKKLKIPLKIFKTNIFEVVSKHAPNEPCYMCSRMRRGHLYNKAKELGCNKIALAHHYDDVIETTLLNLFYNGSVQTMMPKLKSKNFENMELIRPLYLVEEESIISWSNYNDLKFIDCGCMITVCSSSSKRLETKQLINELIKTNPFIKKNIFASSSNVYINSVIQYKLNHQKHHFLNNYDEKK